MSSKSSSSNFTPSSWSNKTGEATVSVENEGGNVYCFCGLKAPLATSNSNENLGRRFFGCRNYKGKGCKFFLWHDGPIESERVKAIIISLRNQNEELVKEISLLRNENKEFRKNGCLGKMCYCERWNDMCDEMATLRAEIQALEAKFRTSQTVARREGNAKKMYKCVFLFSMIILLYLKVCSTISDDTSYARKHFAILALP